MSAIDGADPDATGPDEGAAGRCRDLLRRCREAWRAGHGEEAWQMIDQAAGLQDAVPSLPAEVLAVRAGLLLLAERGDEAGEAARSCLAAAELVTPAPRELRLAVADARVTLATTASRDAVPGATGQPEELARALSMLDTVARDPALAGSTPAARAVNNGLLLRIEQLTPALHTTSGQVEAWMRVSEARAVSRGWHDQGATLRQAVDLAFPTGQWERGWDHAHQQIAAEQDRNEQVAVLAKAALLAWHRRMLPETRQLGARARRLSVAVDHPWVRTYAYLGGVLEAAAEGGSMTAALTAYTRCTSTAGHATRPNRAWLAAQVALDAGHTVDRVRVFLHRTLPGGLNYPRLAALARVVLADREGGPLAPADLQAVQPSLLDVPDRARVALARARWHRRHDQVTAAAAALHEAQSLLRDWPGRLWDEVEDEIDVAHTPVQATPAQRRVLDLLAEGLGNADIADRLDCSERTVAVHVAGLLRANGLRSRTQLAVRHLRHELR